MPKRNEINDVLCLLHKPTGQLLALIDHDNFYGCDAADKNNSSLDDFIRNIFLFHGKVSQDDFELKIIAKEK